MMSVPNGYYAIVKKQMDGVDIEFPDFWNIIASASDWDQAQQQAETALAITLQESFERGFDLPIPSEPKATARRRVIFVAIPLDIRMAYVLRNLRQEAGLTQAEMARRLGIRTQSYTRMEKPGRANLQIGTLERIAKALGRRVEFSFGDVGADAD